MPETSVQVSRLREAGAEFSRAFETLLSFRTAAKLDPKVRQALAKLLNEGASIKSAIRAATQMLDGAKRWTDRVFQTDALDTIPFASEIVETTAAAAVSSIEHFLDKTKIAIPHLEKLQRQFSELPEEKRTQLAAVETSQPTPAPVPAFILLIVLGGVIWWFNSDK